MKSYGMTGVSVRWDEIEFPIAYRQPQNLELPSSFFLGLPLN